MCLHLSLPFIILLLVYFFKYRKRFFICQFLFFFNFETELCFITALDILEHTMQTKMNLNSQSSACCCLSNAGIKGMCYQCSATRLFLKIYSHFHHIFILQEFPYNILCSQQSLDIEMILIQRKNDQKTQQTHFYTNKHTWYMYVYKYNILYIQINASLFILHYSTRL